MNCIWLLLLLFGCGGNSCGNRDCNRGCDCGRDRRCERDKDCGRDRRCERDKERGCENVRGDRDCGCGAVKNDRERERERCDLPGVGSWIGRGRADTCGCEE